ncbi:DNA polymerase III [Pseudomonas syringae pv. actinidiae]|uniref:DNA polymerase III n=1 Tax=Pseudomonas syringae pv. actinidiae TaxID=103796 RepID=A0A2V0QBT0_PSESF|nr:DNA polymerase III [Pseudomonas syringae pv. actinidiae]
MLCKAQRHLHLFTIGYTAVKTPTMAQDAMNVLVVLGSRRLGQLPAHHVVGQISQQFEVRHLRQHVEGKQQITGETVTVSFQQNRKVHLLGQTLPALDQRNRLGQRSRTYICLQSQVMTTVAACNFKRPVQIGHSLWE